MIPLPNQLAKFVDKMGRLIPPWNSYLQQFTQQPPSFADIVLGPSPFSYVAAEPGNVHLNGGTVSSAILSRGLDTLNFTGARSIPVAIRDVVTVTYSVLPTMKFIPSYGQNTNR